MNAVGILIFHFVSFLKVILGSKIKSVKKKEEVNKNSPANDGGAINL